MATRTRNLRPILALAAIALLVIGGVVWRQSTSPADAVVDPAGLGDAGLAIHPATGPASPPDVAAPRPMSHAAAPTRIGSDERRKMIETRTAQRKAAAARVSGAANELATRYRTERVDPQWAAGMEGRLQEVASSGSFADSGIEASSVDIDCRSSTCRIEAGLDTRSAGDDWAMIYMSSVGSNLQRAYTSVVAAPDGTSRVVIYAVAR